MIEPPKEFREALITLHRDLDATGREFDRFQFRHYQGRWQLMFAGATPFRCVNVLYGDDDGPNLIIVAEAAQEEIMERDFTVWPTCSRHGLGLHPTPAGEPADWSWSGDGREVATASWTCATDGNHVVAKIGELAGA